MLHKRLKKIICILSAVIIAFSCFCIPASASTASGDFSFSSIDFFAGFTIFDSIGNPVEDVLIPADKYIINSSGDSLYIDISSSEYPDLFKPGWSAFLMLTWDYSLIPNFEEKSIALCFTFSKGVTVVDSQTADGYRIEKLDSSYICLADNSFANFMLETDRNFNTFSFVVTFDKTSSITTSPIVAPGMFKFFSDIGIFFSQSVDWFTSIFSKVVTAPALTVLVIGFLIVSFSFGLLRRLLNTS